jgi:cyanate permease
LGHPRAGVHELARHERALGGGALGHGATRWLFVGRGLTLMGLLRDISGSWRAPLVACVLLFVLKAIFGPLAGRAPHIVDGAKSAHLRHPNV